MRLIHLFYMLVDETTEDILMGNLLGALKNPIPGDESGTNVGVNVI